MHTHVGSNFYRWDLFSYCAGIESRHGVLRATELDWCDNESQAPYAYTAAVAFLLILLSKFQAYPQQVALQLKSSLPTGKYLGPSPTIWVSTIFQHVQSLTFPKSGSCYLWILHSLLPMAHLANLQKLCACFSCFYPFLPRPRVRIVVSV